MTILVPKTGENLTQLMRRGGYAPDRYSRPDEPSFSRPIYGPPYPRFHIYVEETADAWLLKLHLDQKKPSYEGATAHSGEYDGPVVEAEADRIKEVYFWHFYKCRLYFLHMNNRNHKQNFIHYDEEADVLAVYIKKGKEEEFVEIAPNIFAELNAEGAIIGIEILNASKVLKPALKRMQQRDLVYAR